MTQPARSPDSPGSRRPRVSATETHRSSSVAGLHALTVHDLPELPSLAALRTLTERDLPATDGLPMPESTTQFKPLTYTVWALARFLRHCPDVFVAGDLLVYYEGFPDAQGRVSPLWIAPDVLVAFGVGSRDRSSYVVWQEGKPPEFVMEIASASTWKRDRDEKPAIYASLGVNEFFLFDAAGGLLEPRLQGHALHGRAYRRLSPERLPNGAQGVRSEVLGLCAYLKGSQRELRWFDPASGKDLEDYDEVHDARDAAEVRVAELEAQIRSSQREPSA